MKLEFSRQIYEKYSNFMKICPVGAVSFYAEGRTDGLADRHNEAISRFTQFRERAQCISTVLTVPRTNDTDVHI